MAGCMYCSREEENKYPAYVVSEDLLSAFIEGDNDWRTQYYIMKESIGGISTNYVYTDAWVLSKVKGWEYGYKESSDHFMFRTAEAYLNAAEAAAYSGIGRNKLRELSQQKNCPFAVWLGGKLYIIREKLDDFTDKQFKI